MDTHTKYNSPISLYFQKRVVILLRRTLLPAAVVVTYVTYLGLMAVTGVNLASTLYFATILLAAILEFGS